MFFLTLGLEASPTTAVSILAAGGVLVSEEIAEEVLSCPQETWLLGGEKVGAEEPLSEVLGRDVLVSEMQRLESWIFSVARVKSMW